MVSPTLSWTPNTSAFHNVADACSLSDVLETQSVPDRFWLTPQAATGILRRARKRGVKLPDELKTALQALSTTVTTTVMSESTRADEASVLQSRLAKDPTATDACTMPRPSLEASRPLKTAPNEARPASFTRSKPPSAANEPEPSLEKAAKESLIHEDIPQDQRIYTAEATAAPLRTTGADKVNTGLLLRRLTPLETERLQGFPDGWTCLCGGTTGALGRYAWTEKQLMLIAEKKAAKRATGRDGSPWQEGVVQWPENPEKPSRTLTTSTGQANRGAGVVAQTHHVTGKQAMQSRCPSRTGSLNESDPSKTGAV